ncbi:AAA-like domain-containing protein [Sorangium sp. So ce1036]|uniref:AAA-like domain-containing protein n=1 Tax=Sorangium sp. So ce1036 TaxID=3133328 RepID=UPI003EFC19C8
MPVAPASGARAPRPDGGAPSRPAPAGSFQPEGRGIVDASGAGLYVVRGADDELFERLSRGEPCHVLAPRQIGKSSLRVRTQERLRADGVRCASIDLTSIGSGASADAWYFSVASAVAEELAIGDDLDAFWRRHRRMSAVRRFRQFLHDLVLGEEGPPAVLFLDEIDVTLSLPFSRDDLFGLIRATHQARSEGPRWSRLTFCLIGVAAPLDLVADPERTPFNTSLAVRLDDFTRDEAHTFLPGLARAGGDPAPLLDAVLDWTDGHPALTQRLCYWLTREGPDERGLPAGERVAALVRRLFLSSGRVDDPILLDAERRFAGDRPDARIPVMLHLYQRLLDGEPVPVDGNNPRQLGLRIAGLAAERRAGDAAVLRVRCRIFAEVFNRAWVEEKLARRFLTEPLQIWKDSGKKDDHVLRGGTLEIALAWATGRDDVTPDERDFLQASQAVWSREQQGRQQAELDRTQRERAEQQVRAQRRMVSVLAASVALMAGSLIVALVLYQRLQLALEEESARRDRDQQVIERLEQGNEARLAALEEARRRAEQELAEAIRGRDAAAALARERRSQADAAQRAAEDARRRAGRSAGRARRAQQLERAATRMADEAAALEVKAHHAAAAAELAARKLEGARAAAHQVSIPTQRPAQSVLGSVEDALRAERAATARLQDELRRTSAEVDRQRAEVERLTGITAQLQEKTDQLTPMRNAAPEQAASARAPVRLPQGGTSATADGGELLPDRPLDSHKDGITPDQDRR